MANKRQNQPIASEPANLSLPQIQSAIPKLKKRLIELQAFHPSIAANEQSPSPYAQGLVDKINHTLSDIFGHTSLEYERYHLQSLFNGMSIRMTTTASWMNARGVYHEPVNDRTPAFESGKQAAITKLQTLISMLEEKISDLAETDGIGIPLTLDGSNLHPAIQAAAGKLYRDQHYAEAIEAACKALNGQVQAKSGIYDEDNTSLMQKVFSPNSPILAFNDLSTDDEKNEQKGIMFLYQGVFLALRNPRAHKLTKDDPQTAFGIIRFINLLVGMLDKTNK